MELTLERIEQRVGAPTWLYPLDLTLVPRAVTVLLGATQAGKTTLMRVMAGLDAPSKGRVLADGEDVTGRPVRERNVAMVYQQFINYPSMTVADNIGSPLRLRGEKNVAARVTELAARLHIEPFLERLPAELSGGQQQRVALARALIMRPPVLLLDEPLAALDLKLRQAMQEELRRIHSDIGGTFVFVTHDQGEAMSLANRLGVMHEGELIQVGSPEDVYRRPKTAFVAAFVGDANILRGSRRAGVVTLDAGARFRSEGPESPVMVVVRPEAIAINQREVDGECTLRGKIGDMIFLGAHIRYSIDVGSPAPIMVQVNPGSAPPMCRGQEVLLSWTPANQTILAP